MLLQNAAVWFKTKPVNPTSEPNVVFQQQQSRGRQHELSGCWTLWLLSDVVKLWPAPADRWGLVGALGHTGSELLMKWGVTERLSETSHWTSRPELGPRWHMGVKEVRKLRGVGGGQAVHSASHETPSCHNRHLPALTLNTHQGEGWGAGGASFLSQTESWQGQRTELKVLPPAAVKSEECWDLPLLCHLCRPAADLLIITAKGWRCAPGQLFHFPCTERAEQSRSRTLGAAASARSQTKHTDEVQASWGHAANTGQTPRGDSSPQPTPGANRTRSV